MDAFESLLGKLEAIDGRLARHIRDVEDGHMDSCSLLPELHQRRQLIQHLAEALRGAERVPAANLSRLLVSHSRGAQLLRSCTAIRNSLENRLADSTVCRNYASRLASLLEACGPHK